MITTTSEDSSEVGSKVDGLTVTDWRAARAGPFSLPGNIVVVEVCSPTYATAAMGTGSFHLPSLPCKIIVYVEGDKIIVSALDTNFMFPTFYSDVPEENQEQMNQMATAVRSDIIKMVEASLASME
jgi:uncharacterized protein (DUF302 family)